MASMGTFGLLLACAIQGTVAQSGNATAAPTVALTAVATEAQCPYRQMTRGTCDATSSFITTKAECEEAAECLGLSDTTASEGSWSGRPAGCYFDDRKRKLFWNRDGKKNDDDTRRLSICFLQAPTPAPTAAPTPTPTVAPTDAPTAAPSAAPSVAPTAAPTAPQLRGSSSAISNITAEDSTIANLTREAMLRDAQASIEAAVAQNDDSSNSSLSSSWWGWHHGVGGETCCMCSMSMGFKTLLYSAGDYDHFFGGHNAYWQCTNECARKCGSDWHHGRYFGCYDEAHLQAMDNQYGHNSRFSIYYGHFGGIC